jgi:hypothetical protein
MLGIVTMHRKTIGRDGCCRRYSILYTILSFDGVNDLWA